MKQLLVLSALVLFAAVTGAAGLPGAHAAQTPANRSAPAVTADDLARYLQVARGYETCVLRCEDRYQACVSSAGSDNARRSCRLDRSLCEADCGRFGSR